MLEGWFLVCLKILRGDAYTSFLHSCEELVAYFTVSFLLHEQKELSCRNGYYYMCSFQLFLYSEAVILKIPLPWEREIRALE